MDQGTKLQSKQLKEVRKFFTFGNENVTAKWKDLTALWENYSDAIWRNEQKIVRNCYRLSPKHIEQRIKTKFSPFQLVDGRHLILKVDDHLEKRQRQKLLWKTLSQMLRPVDTLAQGNIMEHTSNESEDN